MRRPAIPSCPPILALLSASFMTHGRSRVFSDRHYTGTPSIYFGSGISCARYAAQYLTFMFSIPHSIDGSIRLIGTFSACLRRHDLRLLRPDHQHNRWADPPLRGRRSHGRGEEHRDGGLGRGGADVRHHAGRDGPRPPDPAGRLREGAHQGRGNSQGEPASSSVAGVA